MLQNLIKIEVTEDIAAKIRAMAEAGIFSIKTGNASLNFHEGALKSIKTEFMTYPLSPSLHPIDSPEVGIILKQ